MSDVTKLHEAVRCGDLDGMRVLLDYPDGTACPQCPFWANRDRWSGELLR